MATTHEAVLDRFTWLPIKAATILAISNVAVFQLLGFIPISPSPWFALSWIRDVLMGMIFPLVWLPIAVAFELSFLWRGIAAALRRRRWRTLSFVCASIMLPIIVVEAPRLIFCSPYYWYVLWNQARLEHAATALAQPGHPALVKLEGRDVSFGLVSNPATFTSIVYDEADIIRDDPAPREKLSAAQGGADFYEGATLGVRHLIGHFYLVSATF